MFLFNKAAVLLNLWLMLFQQIHARNVVEAPPTNTTMANTSPSWDTIFRTFLGDKLDSLVSILIDY